MKTLRTVPNVTLSNTGEKQATQRPSVILKEGKSGLRFGPVTTGQLAMGKDACGY